VATRLVTEFHFDRADFIAAAWVVVFAAVSLWLTRGGVPLPPDSVEYAEVARSLAQGDGYTINMVEFHPGFLPSIRHPPELHGLLQPILILPLFSIWGLDLALVRIPGLLFLACLGVTVFWATRRLFGSIAAAVALGSLLATQELVLNAYMGGDDVGFAFLSFGALIAFVFDEESAHRSWFALGGAFAALATLQKFSGVVLPIVAGVTLLSRRDLSPGAMLRRWIWVAGPVAAAAMVYLFRNYLVHGGMGFRFTPVDWFAKNDPRAYFALYWVAPTLSDVWNVLGPRRLAELVGDQFRLLRIVLASEWALSLGGLAALFVLRERRTWRWGALSYWLILVLVTTVAYHVEGRYLLGLLPVGAVSLGGVAARSVELARARFGGRAAQRAVKGWVLVVLALAVIGFGRMIARGRSLREAGAHSVGCDDAAAYLKRTARRSSPVLTANPWFVSWAAERPAVMAPTGGPDRTRAVIAYYGIDWALSGAWAVGAPDLDDELFRELVGEPGGPGAKRVFRGPQCSVYRLRRNP
jgi:4-amino-4-deoxy-L-arabinose transferase-like glycosyltransferase